MKVKIVKAPNNYWYGNKIGQEFEVNDKKTDFIFYVKEGEFKERAIRVEDCELITPVKIPFSFEAWDKDRTQKVWTRDGREVKQLTWFENVEDGYPIVGNVSGKGLRSYSKEGRYTVKSEKNYDLFLEHHEREYWVNVFRSGSELSFGMVFTDEEQANKKIESAKNFVKTISFKA